MLLTHTMNLLRYLCNNQIKTSWAYRPIRKHGVQVEELRGTSGCESIQALVLLALFCYEEREK